MQLLLTWPTVTLALSEPRATAVFLVMAGLLIAASVLLTRTVDRVGIPVVLLFMVIGMLGGSEGIGGVEFDDYGMAVRLGTLALVLILFDGGMNTSISSIRQVLYPASVLATAGVAMTAGFLALCGRLLGLSWPEALLLGAVVSSTDAAAVFAVLRGGSLQLKPRVGRTLEVESCINDPMAVILTTSLIGWFSADEMSTWRALLDVPIQLGVGAVVGIVLGLGGVGLLRRARLGTVGLYPVLSIAVAFTSFGVATVLNGSGFMACYATGVVLGNRAIPYRAGLGRFHDSAAWMSQVGMFLMMGLLVYPSQLVQVAWVGLGLGLLLAFVARPLTVVLCLWPFKYSWTETLYVGWIGLRGAVPIILATFPVLAEVDGAFRIFNIVFFIVVVSSLIPGATIRPVTRRLKLNTPEEPAPAAVMEINATMPLKGELTSFHIKTELAVCDATLSEIEMPERSGVVLIVRGDELVAARGRTRLQAGDHAYVFFRPEDRSYIELLFGRPEEE